MSRRDTFFGAGLLAAIAVIVAAPVMLLIDPSAQAEAFWTALVGAAAFVVVLALGAGGGK